MNSTAKLAMLAVTLAIGPGNGQYRDKTAQDILAEAEARARAREHEKRESVRAQEYALLKRARKFVDAWNEFAKDYAEGKVNVAKAIEASEAFHKLEKHPLWPGKTEKSR